MIKLMVSSQQQHRQQQQRCTSGSLNCQCSSSCIGSSSNSEDCGTGIAQGGKLELRTVLNPSRAATDTATAAAAYRLIKLRIVPDTPLRHISCWLVWLQQHSISSDAP
jgi:hypothetical protein